MSSSASTSRMTTSRPSGHQNAAENWGKQVNDERSETRPQFSNTPPPPLSLLAGYYNKQCKSGKILSKLEYSTKGINGVAKWRE